MPDDSRGTVVPTLPHTWRPLGVRVAVVFFGAMLLIVCIAAWYGFDPSVRDRFTFLQRATLVGFGLCFALAGWSLGRSRATATEDGLVVVNGLRRRRYDWAQVVAVHLGAGAPWATLDLADGTTVSVMAFQGADGRRARQGVRELRALLER
jgi:hypothetical protein